MELSLLGAFLGGILTLLSPCSVMLLPAFFAYAFSSPAALLGRSTVFFLGLATTLVPLGMLAGSLGSLVNQYRFELVTVASIIVIVLGLIMLLGVPVPGLVRQEGAKSASIVSVFALGMVYGLAGVCAGPLLGAALTFAAFGANAVYGGIVLLVFAVGMVFPLFILALIWERMPWVKHLVRPRELVVGNWRNSWTQIVAGALTAGIGVLLLFTRGTTSLGGVLGATDQAQLEAGVMQWTAGVPGWVAILVFVLLIAAAATILLLRRHERQTSNR